MLIIYGMEETKKKEKKKENVYYLFHSAENNWVIYILPEIYFTNLYRFTETENLLYIDLKTCQYHSVHFRYNLYKLVSIFQVICILPNCFQLSETDNIHISWKNQVIYILPDYTD